VQLDYEFTVPVPASQAWPVLMDVERIAPCMPGATVTRVDGSDVEGTVKVKVGPIVVTYSGTATFLDMDEAARRAVIEARGRETRGSGTASARVTTQLHDEGEKTRVTVSADLSITGKPAQFGRGVMSDVGGKLLGQFADCLARELAGPAAGEAPGTAPAAPNSAPAAPAGQSVGEKAPASLLDATGPPGQAAPSPAAQKPAAQKPAAQKPAAQKAAGTRPTADTIDLLGAAGVPVLKRLAPALVAAALLALLVAVLRRRR
jgi:carbon monoxide dehydrogenase subunit G